MGKVEGIIRFEIVRLAKREMRKMTIPLGRDVRSLKGTVSQLRKTVSLLEKFAARQGSGRESEKFRLQATPEEVKSSRFSPRLIRALRKRLGITQKELATLAGVTVGAIYQWEKGIFDPRGDKKATLVGLRRLGRRDVKQILGEKKASVLAAAKKSKRTSPRRKRGKRRPSKRRSRR